MAVTLPLPSTVATVVLLLLHAPVPPPNTTPFAVKGTEVTLIHRGEEPVTEVIAAFGFTVTEGEVAVHPVADTELFVGVAVKINVVFPWPTPVTRPEPATTVAILVLLLAHVPV